MKGRYTVAPSEYSCKGNNKSCLDIHIYFFPLEMFLFAVFLAVHLFVDGVLYMGIKLVFICKSCT